MRAPGDEDGEGAGVVGGCRNIRERDVIESELRLARERVIEAGGSRGAAGVASAGSALDREHVG